MPYLNSTMDYINNNHNIHSCRILINNDNLNRRRKETSFMDIYEPNPDCRYAVRNLAELIGLMDPKITCDGLSPRNVPDDPQQGPLA